jgi:hypothetical protein
LSGPFAVGADFRRRSRGLPGSLADGTRDVPLEADLGSQALHCVQEIQVHRIVDILPSPGRLGIPGAKSSPSPEEIGEDVSTPPSSSRLETKIGEEVEIETCSSSCARICRTITRSLVTEEVVLLPLFRIAEHLIGLIDLLEFSLSALIVRIDIRMVFSGEPAIGLPDLFIGGTFWYSQDLIIVLFGHPFRPYRL